MKDEKDELYNLTSTIIEFCFDSKIISIVNSLDLDDMAELNTFFFMTYQKISEKGEASKDPKKSNSSKTEIKLKPSKLIPLHQELLEKGSIGMMHRSMFSIKKNLKE